LAVAVSGLVCLWCWRAELSDSLSLIGDRGAIVAYLEQYQGWGPVFLALIFGNQVFLAIIPGTAFMVAAGCVHGFLSGALITQVSAVVASRLAYLLVRRAGRPFSNRTRRVAIRSVARALEEMEATRN